MEEAREEQRDMSQAEGGNVEESKDAGSSIVTSHLGSGKLKMVGLVDDSRVMLTVMTAGPPIHPEHLEMAYVLTNEDPLLGPKVVKLSNTYASTELVAGGRKLLFRARTEKILDELKRSGIKAMEWARPQAVVLTAWCMAAAYMLVIPVGTSLWRQKKDVFQASKGGKLLSTDLDQHLQDREDMHSTALLAPAPATVKQADVCRVHPCSRPSTLVIMDIDMAKPPVHTVHYDCSNVAPLLKSARGCKYVVFCLRVPFTDFNEEGQAILKDRLLNYGRRTGFVGCPCDGATALMDDEEGKTPITFLNKEMSGKKKPLGFQRSHRMPFEAVAGEQDLFVLIRAEHLCDRDWTGRLLKVSIGVIGTGIQIVLHNLKVNSGGRLASGKIRQWQQPEATLPRVTHDPPSWAVRIFDNQEPAELHLSLLPANASAIEKGETRTLTALTGVSEIYRLENLKWEPISLGGLTMQAPVAPPAQEAQPAQEEQHVPSEGQSQDQQAEDSEAAQEGEGSNKRQRIEAPAAEQSDAATSSSAPASSETDAAMSGDSSAVATAPTDAAATEATATSTGKPEGRTTRHSSRLNGSKV